MLKNPNGESAGGGPSKGEGGVKEQRQKRFTLDLGEPDKKKMPPPIIKTVSKGAVSMGFDAPTTAAASRNLESQESRSRSPSPLVAKMDTLAVRDQVRGRGRIYTASRSFSVAILFRMWFVISYCYFSKVLICPRFLTF